MLKISNRSFFVYGTLLPGQPNAYLWADAVVAQERAMLANGRLYDLGHYPMLIEEGDAPVQGVLLTVREEAYTAVLARLDYLEGYIPAQHEACAYQRMVREVWLEDGRSSNAWVYIGQPRFVVDLVPLEGKDWGAHVSLTAKQSSAWWANIKSVSGLLD